MKGKEGRQRENVRKREKRDRVNHVTGVGWCRRDQMALIKVGGTAR